MKALRYYGPEDIRFETMDDPAIIDNRDAIVKVLRCAICGSDLHIFHGAGFSQDIGYCVGHEAVGEVVEVGSAVRRLKVGDQVMLSAAVGCGACAQCLAGNIVNCATNGGACYGLSNALQGSQAEAVRVPAADFNSAKIPEGVTLDQALMLTDALATAWFGCENADIEAGKTVAVVGLGPIGLMTIETAFLMGAARVYAIDPLARRRRLAERAGATGIPLVEAVEVIREATAGRMADCVIEAVGADASIALALRLVGKRGTVSIVGATRNRQFEFPIHRAFAMGLTLRIGTCSVLEHWPALIPLIQAGRLRPERYISHCLQLRDGTLAYQMLDQRLNDALKMVLVP